MLVGSIKTGIEFSSFKKNKKIAEFAIPSPTPLSFLSCKLPGIKPWSTVELPATLTNKPYTQVKECHLYMYMICKMVKSHFPMVEIPFPDISSLKTQSVDCFSVLIFQDNFANTVFHSNFVSALC